MVARHLRHGQLGEEMARAFLGSQGYEVLEMNWRCRCGELDLICRIRDTVVFVEVKTRSTATLETPAEALTQRKQTKLIKSASLFLSQRKLWHVQSRFDLVSVYLQTHHCQVDHVPNAFTASHPVGRGHSNWQPW
ncbi:YraN family protein [Desulfovermiculus halophilus]|jgi:putative endonuclease|uniref:YraN family protein n=1 Tax=Desulfovermiculus halophilus TaxID=339722 RepID=UPI000482965F|nr:YraN family protein [Desulfovermiculus halophilus]